MNPTYALPRGMHACGEGALPEARGRLRRSAYVIVAVAGLVTGFLLGLAAAGDTFGPRAPASPDSLLPHPRAIQR